MHIFPLYNSNQTNCHRNYKLRLGQIKTLGHTQFYQSINMNANYLQLLRKLALAFTYSQCTKLCRSQQGGALDIKISSFLCFMWILNNFVKSF